MIFLSTSRVYPVAPQLELELREEETRFALEPEQPVAGASEHGIAEDFPLEGARTLYGATKLAAELLLTEYADSFGVRATIDRCGVIAGPWQMGKVDQGVFTHWLLAHYAGRPLTYIGYGGTGKQVRDLLHVDDLCDLVIEQLADPDGLERRDGQRRRRRRGLAVAARDDRPLRRADRQRGRDRAGRRGAAGRRAALRVGLPARCSSARDWRPARDAADGARGHARVDRGERARGPRGAGMSVAAERPAPPPRRRRPARARRRGIAVGRSLAVLVAGLALLLVARARDDVLLRRVGLGAAAPRLGLDALLAPHNEHLSLVPVLVFKALFSTVGIDAYVPYRVAGLVVHALVVVLLFVYARRRVGDLLALAAAAMILFLGHGAGTDVLWPFQIGFLGSLAAGIGALLALDRERRRGDVTRRGPARGRAGLVLARDPAAAALAVEVLGRPDRRAALVGRRRARGALRRVVRGLRERPSTATIDNFFATPEYVAEAAAGAAGAMFGARARVGPHARARGARRAAR